ncbi:MAG: DNA polymerase IV [Anaerovoracaceae bacterium]
MFLKRDRHWGSETEMIVMHIDANSAYLSWTAVSLLEKGAELDIRTVPAVIAGDPENRQGIILAKSLPAKKYKIGAGTSLFEAKHQCPELLVFPPDYDLYLKCSEAMYKILKEYSPIIQRYSIDECFLDYTNCVTTFGEPEKTAYIIKERIKNELGFTVNIGIGSNKLCAKMAGELKKPDMVHTLLTRKEIEQKLWPLEVNELFMVGRATTKKLHRININTIGELAMADPNLLRSIFKSHGTLIWNYANGIDCDRVRPNDEILQKGLGNSMTIKYDVTNREDACKYLLALTDRVTGRLRRQQCKAALVSVWVKTNSFVRYSHQLALPIYTDDTTTIYNYICRLFDECWKGEPIRHLGVGVSEFSRKDDYQLTIFEQDNLEKAEAMNKAVDTIRMKFGQLSIYRGTFVNTDLKPMEGGVNDGDYLMMGGYKQ